MFCRSCGKELSDDASFCPQCGTACGNAQPQQPYYPSNGPYYAPYPPRPVDTGSIGWLILGFLIPLVGLILFLVWIDSKPKSAQMAGMGALLGVIFSIIVPVMIFCLFLILPSSSTLVLII